MVEALDLIEYDITCMISLSVYFYTSAQPFPTFFLKVKSLNLIQFIKAMVFGSVTLNNHDM